MTNLRPNTIFYSKYFRGHAKVVSVDPTKNSLSVEISHPSGSVWIEDDWNLEHTLWGFESKDYSLSPVSPARTYSN